MRQNSLYGMLRTAVALVLVVVLYVPALGAQGTQHLNEELLNAVKLFDTYAMRELLANGADPNVRDKDGTPVVLVVARGSFYPAVRLFVEKGANVNVTDNKGGTALMMLLGSKEAKFLLERGADANARDNEGRTALMQAAAAGYEKDVRVLLKFGADVNAKDNKGRTALSYAARRLPYDVVVALLLAGADVNASDKKGLTPLMYAAQSGREKNVETLLIAGARTDVRDGNGNTASMLAEKKSHKDVLNLLKSQESSKWDTGTTMIWAAALGDVEKVNDLLTQGVDANARVTALMAAAWGGREEAVRVLIDSGAAENADASDASEALAYAVESGNAKVVELLLESTAKAGQKGPDRKTMLNNALITAVEEGYAEIGRLLLDRGADKNAKTASGDTVLTISVAAREPELTKLLLDRGARVEAFALARAADLEDERCFRWLLERLSDISARDDRGSTPLTETCFWGNAYFVKLLLDKGADVNIQADHGSFPLHYAVRANRMHSVRLLLERGADVNARDFRGRTALDWAYDNYRVNAIDLLKERGAVADPGSELGFAAWQGDAERVRNLLDKGANIDTKTPLAGRTPLMRAIVKGHLQVVRLLVERGANVGASDELGSTVLMYAVSGGRKEAIVKMLLEKHADARARDNYGDTALMRAVMSGAMPMVKLMVDADSEINAKDRTGRTALDLAYDYEFDDIVTLLKEHGGSANVDSEFSYAAAKGDLKRLQNLLAKGTKVNTRTYYQRLTPLMRAASAGHLEAVRFLLENGAEVHAVSSGEKSSIDMAQEKGYTKIVELITSYEDKE